MIATPSETAAKLETLRAALRALGSALVAFSAGVDSTFLLRVAHEELGDRAVAATARSRSFPAREFAEAAAFCRSAGVEHVVVDSEELDIPGFADNPPDRCYHCKKELFGKLAALARNRGLAAVLEGSNLDDDGDWRPGRRAIRELGVRSPLHDACLTKAEIRRISRSLGLPTADKPCFACLASRFPYGERITAEGLARVEVAPDAIPLLAARAAGISAALRALGFAYVSLDLQGYRTGSLNETLRP